jgi:hypothetical protein
MIDDLFQLSRRDLLQAAILMTGALATRSSAQQASPGPVVSVREFGAVAAPGRDNTKAIQAAVDALQGRGGTVEIPGTYECGTIIISGDGVTLRGRNGWLVNGRIVIPEGRQGCRVEQLGIVDRRGDDRSYALDVSGRNCSFTDVTLVKDPIAGGYQIYLRQQSSGCRFTALRLKGSNGIMVAGHDHIFERFEFESTMSNLVGGDDAFAIKALGAPTFNITIRDGLVRGYSAIASFGSEIGSSSEARGPGSVRHVLVSNVTADRCSMLAFFKPGALIYDWRNGLVEDIRLEQLRLSDERGERFTSGVRMIAARGAIIRNVVGRQLEIRARAKNQGVQPTAAVDLSLLQGADARIENIDLQMVFTDPYDGAAHAAGAPGYPVDHIARIEKVNPHRGGMRGISLDITGRGSRFGGVFIGAGLDDAVALRRAHLSRVGLDPPASVGGGGIWSDSRVQLGDISLDSPVLPKLGGRALGGPR